MPRLVWVGALSVSLCALSAYAEIFKCVAKDGSILYQNFKCEVESLGSMPSASTTAVPATAPARDASAQTPKIVTAEKARDSSSTPSGRAVRIGMTTDQVRSILGEPTDMYQDELVEGRVDIWHYGSNRSIKFDVNGKVIEMQP